MIRSLKRYLKRKAIEKARQAYDQAFKAHADARERRDTRNIHTTSEALTQAASALLRAEVAR